MLTEFRQFIEKFNAVPIAIGLVMATAFAAMVDALVEVMMSFIGAIFGAPVSFDALTFELSGTPIPYGKLITAIVSFLTIAWAVFVLVKAMNRAGAKVERAATPDQALLTEIRDLLANRRHD